MLYLLGSLKVYEPWLCIGGERPGPCLCVSNCFGRGQCPRLNTAWPSLAHVKIIWVTAIWRALLLMTPDTPPGGALPLPAVIFKEI